MCLLSNHYGYNVPHTLYSELPVYVVLKVLVYQLLLLYSPKKWLV